MISRTETLNNRFLPSVLVLITVFFFTACGDKQVATATTENDANKMFSILKENRFDVAKVPKIAGDKTEGWDIVIREGYFGEGEGDLAITLLNEFGLPRKPEPAVSPGGIGITSGSEQEDIANRQLKMRVEDLIYALPDVVNVQAVIGMPKKEPFSLEKPKVTASVIINVYSDQPRFTQDDVKRSVASAVENLNPADVSVQIYPVAIPESFPAELEELDRKRRANMILYSGIGVVLLLSGVLGAILFISKRRKAKEDAEQLTEGEEERQIAEGNRLLTEGNEE